MTFRRLTTPVTVAFLGDYLSGIGAKLSTSSSSSFSPGIIGYESPSVNSNVVPSSKIG